MKNSLALTIFCILLLTSVNILASEADNTEEYDEDLYGPEEPIIWQTPVKGAVFFHKIHTMENELDCDSCHDDVFEMESGAAEEQEDFTMAAMHDGKYCGVCHDGDTAFASDKRCTLCHIGVRGVDRLSADEKAEEGSGH